MIARLLMATLLACSWNSLASGKEPASLQVSAVQMRSGRNLSENLQHIQQSIRECGSNGSRVVAFPECALTGYFEDIVTNIAQVELVSAEEKIAATCREADVYALVGTVWREGDKLFNSVTIFHPAGKVLGRYHKIQLAESWPSAGEQMIVFNVDGAPCSIIICHDERYPELVRLPVLAGAKIIFYLSHESGLREERKIGPYRAQIQARAVENHVFVVQANAPANQDLTGSHGHSRIIAPDGNIIEEAGIFDQQIITSKLDLKKATRANAKGSLSHGPLKGWWKEGLKHVEILE